MTHHRFLLFVALLQAGCGGSESIDGDDGDSLCRPGKLGVGHSCRASADRGSALHIDLGIVNESYGPNDRNA